ncbi:MAG: hypothetical protein PHH54_00155 [Candidatus Nanoarchaeia archaeon]|nr:hypothetical protein [Candidatus Nanoarchaeia archaeon]MDD5740374.1 hypothetical protein [Candidatus Nanoarchaeia archaeon]
MEFQEFLRKQEEVYDKFRDTSKLQNEGTKPDIPKSQGGYLIVLRHPLEIAQKIEEFSRRISQAVPAIVYDSATVHTTISDLGIKGNFAPEKDTLERLCNSVRGALIVNKPTISYLEWLYNQNTVIVAGMPNQVFLEVAQNVYSSAEGNGVQLRLPWGAHITSNRFAEQKSPEELTDFFKLMNEAPVLGNSVPKNIDVAYFDFSPKGFKTTTYERFSLK